MTEPKKKQKQKLIEETVDIAKKIKDESLQVQVISSILVATDKFINEKYAKKLRSWLSVTKVSRIFEEEKVEAVNMAIRQKGEDFVKQMLEENEDIVKIMKYTGFTKEEINKIQRELNI